MTHRDPLGDTSRDTSCDISGGTELAPRPHAAAVPELPPFWDAYDRAARELPNAWAATLGSRSRAWSRRAYRLPTPDQASLDTLAELLASSPPVVEPGSPPVGWLTGPKEYVGVLCRHPRNPEQVVVAAGGVLTIGTEHEITTGRGSGRLRVDADSRVETLILKLIGDQPDRPDQTSALAQLTDRIAP